MNAFRLYLCRLIVSIVPDMRAHGVKNWLLKWAGAELGSGVKIGSSARISVSGRLSIGNRVWIGSELLLMGYSRSTYWK